MLLDFSKVRDGRSTQRFELRPGDPLLGGLTGTLTRPLGIGAHIVEQPHRSFLVRLALEGELELACRRCLRPARQRIDEVAMLLFAVEGPRAAAPLPGEDVDVLPLRSLYDRAEIGPAVREVLFLAVENFPVCSPECLGLCPRCGEDLNADACGCPPEPVHPAWRGLEQLAPLQDRAPAAETTDTLESQG